MSSLRDHGPRPAPFITIPKRRVAFLFVALLLLLIAVGTRTVWLQSVKQRTLSQYADGQQQNTQILPAVRGDILDRNGEELAVGEEAVTFYATPSMMKDPAATALRVSRILGLSRIEEEQLVERLANPPSQGFVYVARQVPREKAELLQDAKAEDDARNAEAERNDDKPVATSLTSIGWNDEENRMYPNGKVAGQIIGAVNIDNMGIAGIESLYDRSLTGTPGKQVVVRDPQGTPIDVLKLQRERDGKPVQLTIDSVLQAQAEGVLERVMKSQNATSATAIVLDPRTGEVLVAASAPRVDPEKWSSFPGIATRVPAITDQFEPGSTFKVVAVAGALEDKVVEPDTSFVLPPTMTFCKEKKTCTVGESHKRGTVVLNTADILVQSSNIGTIKIAQRLGQKQYDVWTRRFGFGAPTGIDFPGEIQGTVTPFNEWTKVSIGNIPIGQGIAVTPIQLISAYAAIANDGVLVQPHLRMKVGNEKTIQPKSRRILSAKTAATMRGMFGGVVEEERGTGRKSQIPGYKVGGKTGTANFAENGVYVKGRYNASFVGFVPANNPRLVTLVLVNDVGGYGGDVAAPAFEEITEFALKRLSIAPDGLE
ncbi:MAG: penicillin-binding protein 2 [Thermoleophilia bacterium]|nr:penicillin-binding protein 2 [Thermoleophilia bacterium]